MRKIIEKLLVVQERDRRIARLRNELSEIPNRKRAVDAAVERQSEAAQKVKSDRDSALAAVHGIELEIEAARRHVSKLRDQQLQIKSNEEYKALDREITAAVENIMGMEDREIEMMEHAEERETRLAEAEAAAESERSRAGRELEHLDKERRRLESEIERLGEDREVLASDVDESWLKRYNKVFENRGDVAIAGTDDDGTCEACHMNLPPQVINDVKKEACMVSCSFCGRLLYWAG